MTALLITGGRLVDPAEGVDALRDLRIRDGVVVEIGEHLVPAQDEARIDASGALVAPGFIDMHVHLRDPGFPEKETIATGTEAAVRGGFTSVACMPNTNPALDTPAVITNLHERAARLGRCRVYPIGTMTLARKGAQPSDFRALSQAGAVGFSDDGDSVRDAKVMYEAALLAREVSGVFISHCEDPSFQNNWGSPPIAEELIVARDLLIAQASGKNWHVAHLSTRGGLELVHLARDAGVSVTCEVTPHHLTLTDADACEFGPAARVNPPLRGAEDRAALREAVRDGTIDVLATDHAPHTSAEKSGAPALVAPGYSGLEIALGAYALALPDLPMRRFVELLSRNPARILGIEGGTLSKGSAADVTIFAQRAWLVDPSTFASKGKTTPFAGRRLPYKVLATIVGGELRYRATELAA